MPTVRDDVAFGPANLGLRGAELDARVAEALDARRGRATSPTAPPHHLSFGQRRRVAIATVLAMRPEILVLDEPSSNLDPASRRELADILRSLDVTVLMVTHDLPYAVELCERSVVLSEGTVVADGPTRAVLGDARSHGAPPAGAARSGSRSRVSCMASTVFDPPERFVAGTVGPPGGRTFFLQASGDGRLVSVSLEKVQVSVLADRVNDLLDTHAEGSRRRAARRGRHRPARHPDRGRVPRRHPGAGVGPRVAGCVVIECHDQDPEEAEEDRPCRRLRVVLSAPGRACLRPPVRGRRLRRPALLPVLRPAAGPDRPHLPACQRIPTLRSSTS